MWRVQFEVARDILHLPLLAVAATGRRPAALHSRFKLKLWQVSVPQISELSTHYHEIVRSKTDRPETLMCSSPSPNCIPKEGTFPHEASVRSLHAYAYSCGLLPKLDHIFSEDG
jgi:hypothetical protein